MSAEDDYTEQLTTDTEQAEAEAAVKAQAASYVADLSTIELAAFLGEARPGIGVMVLETPVNELGQVDAAPVNVAASIDNPAMRAKMSYVLARLVRLSELAMESAAIQQELGLAPQAEG